jgi:hypothetical protein
MIGRVIQGRQTLNLTAQQTKVKLSEFKKIKTSDIKTAYYAKLTHGKALQIDLKDGRRIETSRKMLFSFPLSIGTIGESNKEMMKTLGAVRKHLFDVARPIIQKGKIV